MDHLIRGTALNGSVRVFAVNTTGILEELRKRHGTFPTATAALGRTISAGAMMGAMLKGEEKLTVQIKGNGPLGQIVVDANAVGEVRGYVENPEVHLPLNPEGKLDVGGAVGSEGYLYVIKDLGLKEPYRGSVPLISGELGEDFTVYFAQSEQTPSVVALGVLVDQDESVKASGGFILQLLPGVPDSEIDELERRLSTLPPVTSMLDQGMTLEEMVRWVVDPVTILDRMDVVFRCKCSRERVEATLISLGSEELLRLREEDNGAEVVCHFCNEKYAFEGKVLGDLVKRIKRQ